MKNLFDKARDLSLLAYAHFDILLNQVLDFVTGKNKR